MGIVLPMFLLQADTRQAWGRKLMPQACLGQPKRACPGQDPLVFEEQYFFLFFLSIFFFSENAKHSFILGLAKQIKIFKTIQNFGKNNLHHFEIF